MAELATAEVTWETLGLPACELAIRDDGVR